MKRKDLIVFILMLIAPSSVYSQSNFNFVWANTFPEWYPLTYDCAGEGIVIMDGTLVEIWKDADVSSIEGVIHTDADHILPVGTNGSAGQVWPTNSFVFNSYDVGVAEGSFYAVSFLFQSGTPGGFYYLLIRCPTDGSVLWVSHVFMIPAGYSEIIIGDTLINPPSMPIWSECTADCPVEACDTPPTVDNFQASDNCYHIVLTWDFYDEAEEYTVDSLVIFRGNRQIASLQPTAVRFVDRNAEPGEPVNYKIHARRSCPMLDDRFSLPVSANGVSNNTIDAPEIVSVSTDLCDSVVVIFDNPAAVDIYEEIQLFMGLEMVAAVDAGLPGETDRRIVHNEAPLEAEWYYLQGWSSYCSEGPASNALSGAALTQPERIEGVQATDGHPQFVTVEWDAVEGAEYYRAYRDGEFIDESSLYTVIIDNPPEEGVVYLYQVTAVNACGESEMSEGDWGHFGTTAVNPLPDEGIIESFALHTNYPNPFNQITWIEFDIAHAAQVALVVYDLLGKEVDQLVESNLSQGKYKVGYSAEGLGSGVYLYRLTAGNYTETKKMILMK